MVQQQGRGHRLHPASTSIPGEAARAPAVSSIQAEQMALTTLAVSLPSRHHRAASHKGGGGGGDGAVWVFFPGNFDFSLGKKKYIYIYLTWCGEGAPGSQSAALRRQTVFASCPAVCPVTHKLEADH